MKIDRIEDGVKIYRQLSALCWTRKEGRVRILLITSRDTGRWVIPKGWPMPGLTGGETALREAWEEAGVEGAVSGDVIGSFEYAKVLSRESDREIAVPCTVDVHPVKVSRLARKFPEAKQRERKWVSRKKAAQLVDEPQLAAIIAEFQPA